MTIHKDLLRQAAERCRDASDAELLEALRHLQACFGWETVLELLAELDARDTCWHCHDGLEPEHRPHCDSCPETFDNCDDEYCAAPGCVAAREAAAEKQPCSHCGGSGKQSASGAKS